MDLGIKDRRAIVCASSKGLGRACAVALANEGVVHVTLTARGADALKKTADEIRKANPSITVTEIVGDITTPAGREALLKACPDPDVFADHSYRSPNRGEYYRQELPQTLLESGGNFSYALFERLDIVRKVRDLSPTERQVRHARMGP